MKNKTAASINILKVFRLGFIILALVVQIFPQSGVSSSCNSNNNLRYPNELADFKLYDKAKWKSLNFLESTMDDVRQVMGEPTRAIDTAQLAIPYPGDTKAIQPVLTYEDDQWKTDINFGKYCYYMGILPQSLENHLCQIMISPKRKIPFDEAIISEAFEKKVKKLPNDSWIEYKDKCGLIYIVEEEMSSDNKNKFLYLSRIMYGPSNNELEKNKKK